MSKKCAFLNCHHHHKPELVATRAKKKLASSNCLVFDIPSQDKKEFLNYVKHTGNEELTNLDVSEIEIAYGICSCHFRSNQMNGKGKNRTLIAGQKPSIDLVLMLDDNSIQKLDKHLDISSEIINTEVSNHTKPFLKRQREPSCCSNTVIKKKRGTFPYNSFCNNKIPISNTNIVDMLSSGYYVDKTHFIKNWLEGSSEHLFIVRPRRFGKTLLIETIKKVCEGNANKKLFENCFIGSETSGYKWPKYATIHLDFSRYQFKSKIFKKFVTYRLQQIADEHELGSLQAPDLFGKLGELIEKLSNLNEYEDKVVVLVDSYDSPLTNFDKFSSKHQKLLSCIKCIFEILKSYSSTIQLTFVTGVFTYDLCELGSGANHLVNITLNKNYNTLFGFTKKELTSVFDENISTLAQKLNKITTPEKMIEKIEKMYNGYKFSGDNMSVFNPYSIMMLFYAEEFNNYWYKSCNVSKLFKYLEDNQTSLQQFIHFADYKITEEELLSDNSQKNFNILSLMYQSGYLTIKKKKEIKDTKKIYTLDYPNSEIGNNLGKDFEKICYVDQLFEKKCKIEFYKNLINENFDPIVKIFNNAFKNRNSTLFPKEHYTEDVCIMLVQIAINFLTLGNSEFISNNNEVTIFNKRADIIIKTKNMIYIWELKYSESKENMKKIKKMLNNGLKQAESYAKLKQSNVPISIGVMVFHRYEIINYRFQRYEKNK